MRGISTCAENNTSTFYILYTDIVQLASNFVEFFKKLDKNLLEFATTNPTYKKILRFDVLTISDWFMFSLCDFYVNLIGLQCVARILLRIGPGLSPGLCLYEARRASCGS